MSSDTHFTVYSGKSPFRSITTRSNPPCSANRAPVTIGGTAAGCWTLISSVLVGGFRVAGGSAEDETGGEPEGEGIGEVAVTTVSGVVEDDVTGCEVGLQPIS